MGQSWTNKVRRLGMLCAVNLSLYLNCFAGVEQGEKKVTLNVVEESCVKVFKQIEKQTKMSFFYSTSDIKLPVKVSISVVNAALDEVMERILEGTGLEWVYTDNIITIRKKKERGSLAGSIGDSSITTIGVSGKVTAADGTPIPGATVLVKRTRDGVTTDPEGNFVLANIQRNDLVIFSSVGYETREIPMKGKTIQVKLNVAVNSLDETVIIAYGKTTKRFNTGSISTVKAEDIEKSPVTNVLAAVQGRVPGVVITQEQGTPGGRYSIRIRGRNSINPTGNEPFYVIDGVPYTSRLVEGLYGPGISTGNPLNFINPNDIESIDILKDADATAIYGSRGANGVVLITTKKGKGGKTSVDINVQHGAGKVTRKLSLLNTQEYLEMRREAYKNDGQPVPVHGDSPSAADYDLTLWDPSRYTDWQKSLIGGTATFTNAQASIAGGNGNIQYLIGGGYNRQTTVFPGDGANQKGSVHFNINSTSPNQKFKVTMNGNYMSDDNNLVNADFTNSILLPPNAPQPYNKDGELNWEPTSLAKSTWNNPFAALLKKYSNKTNNLIANVLLGYEIMTGLELKVSLGYTNLQQYQIQTNPVTSFNPIFNITSGTALFSNSTIRSWNVEPQITYKKMLGRGTLDILVGTTIQRNTAKGQTLFASGFSSDALLEDINSAPTISTNGSTNSGYKYNSVFGRFNYNYEGKYIINLTARRDGSNKFGPGNRFGNFGAIGLGWIFSSEDFLHNALPFLSFGKLRASYGRTGNDQIQDYQYINTYSPFGTTYNTFPYQGITGIGADNLFNPDYVWEVNKKFEGGIELGFLKDRILLTVSYYLNRSSNQLINYTLPSFVGFTSVTANLPATVQNNGWEFSLNTINLKSNNFSWNSNLNLTISRNKLLDFPDLETSSYANDYIIGQPLDIIRAYKYAGVDPSTGIYTFSDKDGKKVTDPGFGIDNKLVTINRTPKYYGGVSNSFSFKGITLDVLLQFTKQLGLNYLYAGSGNYPGYIGNQPTTVLSRWQQPGDVTEIQRFSQNYSLHNSNLYAENSDISYTDASYIRLKNVSLSYTLPQSWQQKVHLSNLRIYIQGQNLLTFTKYKGIDPENQSLTFLPPLRVITAGFQINL